MAYLGFRFIRDSINSGGTVLVHCFAGVSRSSTCVIAYLMQEKKKTFFEAFTFVRSKRQIAFPNIGFQKQLAELELTLSGKNVALSG